MVTCVSETNTLTGVMGGMFDPVHSGHLQAAAAARARCGLQQVLLLPCGNPVHRGAAFTAAAHRCAMLRLATQDEPWLQVDTRECDSAEPSRSYNSLLALKQERPHETLCFIVGLDAFLSLAGWYRWREIFDLAHVVVITRPGYCLPEVTGAQADATTDANANGMLARNEVLEELAARRCESAAALADSPAGRILVLEASTPALSSSQLRAHLQAVEPVTGLLPPAVASYIDEHHLYRQA